MFKRINWKALILGFTWLICLSSLVVLMSFIEDKKQELTCTKVKIDISGNQRYIERSEINRLLTQNKGRLRGKVLNTLHIHDIENVLRGNPFIEQAKVYTDMDGSIWVQIKQREPILRILNAFNQDFYIDRNGLKMPISTNYTANVLASNGFIMEFFSNKVDTLKTKIAKDLFTTALFIEKDTLWSQQIEQIYVNANAEFELVPRVGDHKIILGSTDSLATKFNNLLLFYKKALPKVGWNTYKTINLKYANQIVCEKTNADSTIKKYAAGLSTPTSSITTSQDQDTVNTLKR